MGKDDGYHTDVYVITRIINYSGANYYWGYEKRSLFIWGKGNHKAILKIMESPYYDGSYRIIPAYDELRQMMP